jgi:hypothetical protein
MIIDIDDFFNLDNLRLTPEQVAKAPRKPPPQRKPRRMFAGNFVPALPLEWAHTAGCLPGKVLHVALAIWRQAALRKSTTIALPNSPLAGYGVNRRAKRAALLALEKAGLIRVEWKPGRNPIVTIKIDEDTTQASASMFRHSAPRAVVERAAEYDW